MQTLTNATVTPRGDALPRVPGSRATGFRTRVLPNLLAVVWLAAISLALVLPALLHGSHLGPFDLLSRDGLSAKPGVSVHNSSLGDQIDSIMPWTTLAWNEVHRGHLPLWNPFNGFGTPLAFNWQTAAFSLPTLVGYLVPAGDAYTVGIIVTLLIAGTGTFFLGRVMGLGALASAMMGTVFELSGPFVGWLGWPHAAVASFSGWLFASILLVFRQSHRIRSLALLAAVLACAFYAGQPEILTIVLFAMGVFVLVLMGQLVVSRGVRSLTRPFIDMCAGGIAGMALAAPLILPGFQVVSGSIRNSGSSTSAVPLENLVSTVAQGFNGLPIAGHQVDNVLSIYYQEYATFVGAVAIVLAAVAVISRWRQPVVAAFGAVVVVALAIVYFAPASELMGHLPGVGTIAWHRMLLMLAFAVAVLSGVGLDVLARTTRASVWRSVGIGFAGLAGLIGLAFLGTFGGTRAVRSAHDQSIVWALVETVAGGAIVAATWYALRRQSRRGGDRGPEDRAGRQGRLPPSRPVSPPVRLSVLACTGLLLVETVSLLAAGTQIFSSSSQFYAPTPAIATLQRVAGASEVGVGGGSCFNMGILPNANSVYEVHEMALYDPATPSRYFSSWVALNSEPSGIPSFYIFCPLVKTLAVARRYGVGFLLEPEGLAGPAGTILVARAGNEDIYRVPDSGAATLTALTTSGGLPPIDALGTPIEVSHPGPASWRMDLDDSVPSVLRLHLTDVPGWHATIDGKPLGLERYAGIMLQARVPAGRHVVSLTYWPESFSFGIFIACVAALCLAVALVFSELRRRRRGHADGFPTGLDRGTN